MDTASLILSAASNHCSYQQKLSVASSTTTTTTLTSKDQHKSSQVKCPVQRNNNLDTNSIHPASFYATNQKSTKSPVCQRFKQNAGPASAGSGPASNQQHQANAHQFAGHTGHLAASADNNHDDAIHAPTSSASKMSFIYCNGNCYDKLNKMRERLFRILSKVPIQVEPAAVQQSSSNKVIDREPLVIKYYNERSLADILDLHFECSLIKQEHKRHCCSSPMYVTVLAGADHGSSNMSCTIANRDLTSATGTSGANFMAGFGARATGAGPSLVPLAHQRDAGGSGGTGNGTSHYYQLAAADIQHQAQQHDAPVSIVDWRVDHASQLEACGALLNWPPTTTPTTPSLQQLAHETADSRKVRNDDSSISGVKSVAPMSTPIGQQRTSTSITGTKGKCMGSDWKQVVLNDSPEWAAIFVGMMK